MKSYEASFEKTLLAATSYRQFVAAFFSQNTRTLKKATSLSYQSFANRAGFSSKSFIADVIAGRKRITPASFEKVALGLNLNKSWTEYFKYLVATEEDDFTIGKAHRDDYASRLRELKARLTNKKLVQKSRGATSQLKVALGPLFPDVFASLGNIDSGATLDEISQRTRLSTADLATILQDLEDVQILKLEPATNRYKPLMDSIEAEELFSDQYFEADFLRSVDRMRRRFKAQTKSDQSLFMSQTFSVQSSKLNQFRLELSKLVSEFSEIAEAPEGDSIAEICLGFTNNVAGR